MHVERPACPDVGRKVARIERIDRTVRRLTREQTELLVEVNDAGVSYWKIRGVSRSAAQRRVAKHRQAMARRAASTEDVAA